MARRLIPEQDITDAEAKLAAAVRAAVDEQRRTVMSSMRSHGLTASTVTRSQVWSQSAWAKAVTKHVAPVAAAVAAGLAASAKTALSAKAAWGASTATTAMAAHVVDSTLTAGERVGTVLANAASRGDDVMAAVTDALDSAAGWVGDMAGRLAVALGNWATSDLVAHAATQDPTTSYTMVWRCSFLETSRPDHMEADGQTAAPGEMFTLGDETCEFPGDPSLSDAQSINCACYLEIDDNTSGDTQSYDDSSPFGE
jgi:hypothetical protein